MSDSEWQRVDRLFGDALEVPPEERAQWLLQACAGDEFLHAEVLSLLQHHEHPQSALAEPAWISDLTIDPDALLSGSQDPLVGKRVGSYRLEQQLGVGGMGTVYRATRQDGLVEHTVAIKLLRRSSPEFLRRFENECQALALMHHTNIARLFDTGITDEGTPFLVMEYVEGMPIDQHCDAAKASIADRIALVRTVASAVHYAHQNLIVHRDLKPANILVTRDGTAKLLDFGIAKILDRTDSAAATESQARLLTPDYASPEQLRGDLVTTATDVYSLGVVLYQLLTGRRPHDRTTTTWSSATETSPAKKPSAAVLTKHDCYGPPEPPGIRQTADLRQTTPGRLCRSLRGDLDNIVMMALRDDPQRRYLSAQQLREDLERYTIGLPVTARPDAVLYRLSKFLRRNRVIVSAAALVGIALTAGTITTAWQAGLVREQRDAAQQSERLAKQEADHAKIEASSAHQMTEILIGSFLASTVEQSHADRVTLQRLLESQVERVRRQFAAKPHLRANLLDALGRVFANIYQREQAHALVDEASNIREQVFGADSLEFAQSLNSHGELCYQNGEYDDAADFFRRALALHESLPPGVHTDVARLLNNLGVALRQLGQLDEATELHTRALRLRRSALGPEHLDVAESLNNLSAIHMARAEFEQAETQIREALAIRRKALGEQDPLVAQTINNMASAVCAMGQYERGSALLQEAIAHYRGHAAPDHLALARTLGNLAEVWIAQERTEEARHAAEEAVAIHRERLGADHPMLAASLRVCAKAEHALGDFASEQRHADEAIQILRNVYGVEHPSYAMAAGEQGTSLLDRDRAADAEPLLRAAAAVFAANYDGAHPHRVNFEISLAVCLLRMQRFDEAERLFRSTMAALEDESPAYKAADAHLERLRQARLHKASEQKR